MRSTHPHAVNPEPSRRYNARADLLRDGRRDPAVRALPRSEGSEGYLMTASNQIFLVVGRWQPQGCLHHKGRDASLPEAAALHVLGQPRPSIMTMSAVLAEW